MDVRSSQKVAAWLTRGGDMCGSPEQSNDLRHQVWLVYSGLKDAEQDPIKRLEILERCRNELGKVLDEMNRLSGFFRVQSNTNRIELEYE